MSLERFLNKTITYSFYLLFFLVPLAFSPVNFELFEYPKMMLVYGLTALITAAWLGKMVVQKRIYIQRTPLDIPIILYLGSCFLSTFLSINPYTSLWGYYSRSHGGLMSTICYILLYYAFVSNTTTTKTITTIKTILLSSFLAALYGISQRLGIDKDYWVQDVQNRVFSTLGQPNWLGAFLASIIFIPLSLIKKLDARRYSLDAKYLILFTIYFLCLIFTNSKSAILAFWVCFILFIGFNYWRDKRTGKAILPLLILTLSIYLFLGGKTYHYLKKLPFWSRVFSPFSYVATKPRGLVKPEPGPGVELKYAPRISESSEIRKVVWSGAINIWKHYPVFGSGVETFGYAYYNHRPAEHNLLSEWDFLYNRAHNEFLNILACQGIVGLSTYLFLIGSFLWWAFKKIKQFSNETMKQYSNIIAALLCGYTSILITNFFGFSVVITGLLFFLIPAFCFVNAKRAKKETKFYLTRSTIVSSVKRFSYFQITLLLILLLSLLFTVYSLLNRFRADFYFAKGEKFYKTSYLLPALTSLEKAVLLNPKEALYHAYLAKTSAKLAVVYSEATESAEISSQLADLAENEINKALALNSVHLNFYKNRAEVFMFLSYLNPEHKEKALESLLQASKLAPTDAKILYNLSILHESSDSEDEQGKETEKAIKTLEKAISLKPNYLKVYLKLAEIYKKTGQPEKARKPLEFILKNIDPNNKQALEMLEE